MTKQLADLAPHIRNTLSRYAGEPVPATQALLPAARLAHVGDVGRREAAPGLAN